MSPDLAGRTALVTGVAGGLGGAIANSFAAAGARIIGADIDPVRGAAWAEGCQGAQFITADTSSETAVADLVAHARAVTGRLDIAVACAGVLEPDEGVEGLTEAAFDTVMRSHVLSSALLIRHAGQVMAEAQGGVILTLSSPAAERADAAPIFYSSAKAAIVQLTRTSALRLASANVRVNALQPGVIATGLFGRALGFDSDTAERKARALKRATRLSQPLPRAGTPQDVAQAALFLASDNASFITGQVLGVDGGFALGSAPSGDAGTLQSVADLYGEPGGARSRN